MLMFLGVGPRLGCDRKISKFRRFHLVLGFVFFLTLLPEICSAYCGLFIPGTRDAITGLATTASNGTFFNGYEAYPYPNEMFIGRLDSSLQLAYPLQKISRTIFPPGPVYPSGSVISISSSPTVARNLVTGYVNWRESAYYAIINANGTLAKSMALDYSPAPSAFNERITASHFDSITREITIAGEIKDLAGGHVGFFVGKLANSRYPRISPLLNIMKIDMPPELTTSGAPHAYHVTSVSKDSSGYLLAISLSYQYSPRFCGHPGVMKSYVIALDNNLNFINAFMIGDRRAGAYCSQNVISKLISDKDVTYVQFDFKTDGVTIAESAILRVRRSPGRRAGGGKIAPVDITYLYDPVTGQNIKDITALAKDDSWNIFVGHIDRVISVSYPSPSLPPSITNQRSYTDAMSLGAFTDMEISEIGFNNLSNELILGIKNGSYLAMNLKSIIIGGTDANSLISRCMNSTPTNLTIHTDSAGAPSSNIEFTNINFSLTPTDLYGELYQVTATPSSISRVPF